MAEISDDEDLKAEIAWLRSRVAALEATMIHPSAIVDDESVVEAGASIWQFVSVIRHSRVGVGTIIGACAVIDGSRIGNNCRIGSHACLNPGTFIEDEVFFGPRAMTCNDPWPKVDRGDFDLGGLLAGSHICVHVERLASIGAGAILLPGVVVGANSMVAAGSVVRMTVPAGHLHKRSGEIVPLIEQAPRRDVQAAYRDDVVGSKRSVV